MIKCLWSVVIDFERIRVQLIRVQGTGYRVAYEGTPGTAGATVREAEATREETEQETVVMPSLPFPFQWRELEPEEKAKVEKHFPEYQVSLKTHHIFIFSIRKWSGMIMEW